MGVHPSNATRAADRLVNGGLLTRQQSAADRRRTVVSSSPAGRRLVETIIKRRRTAFEEVLGRMTERDQRALGRSLGAFAAAAGEPDEPDRPGWEWAQ
jgi:DNA-binding MarR family transcriptional regulator